MKQANRWFYVVVGVVLLLFAGLIYAWSILSIPIASEFNSWTKAQLSMAFTVTMVFFCTGGILSGFLAKKIRPGYFVMASAALFGGGMFFTSKAQFLWQLYLFFGVFCGLASGVIYNCVMGTVNQWFADCQGLTSGILLMGFGFSSFLTGKIYQRYTPDTIGAWRISFQWMAALIFIVFTAASFVMKAPDKHNVTATAEKSNTPPSAMEATPKEMLRTPQFWLYYIWVVLFSVAGLTLVSHASGIALQVSASMTPARISTVVGLISIFNGMGRVMAGSMFDRIGRRITMQVSGAVFIAMCCLLFLALGSGNLAALIAAFAAGGFGYGMVPSSTAAFTSSYYGAKNYSINLPIVNTNMIIGSFGSTIAGTLYDKTQSYISSIIMILAVVSVGILCSCGISFCDIKQQYKQKRK